MFVHFLFRKVTAQASGKRTEAVTCEKCQTRFYYELARTGIGSASAPILFFDDAARRRAHSAAERNLQLRLSREAELVACPRCQWINQELIEKCRRQRFRQAPLLGVILLIAGVLTAMILDPFLPVTWGKQGPARAPLTIVLLSVSLLAPAWMLLFRRWLRQRLNPNKNYPHPPPPPAPGTPPALMEYQDPENAQVYLRAILPASHDPHERDGWAILRWGQFAFPNVCCTCLELTHTTYRPPLLLGNISEIAIPMCGPCRSRLRRFWWLLALLTVVLALAISYLISLEVRGIDEVGRWIMMGFLGLFGAVFGVAVLPSRLTRPFKIRWLDKRRSIARFKATNPVYTQFLIDRPRAADGLASRT
jgi:hypothetical protein